MILIQFSTAFARYFVLNPLKICQNVHFFMPTTLIPGGSLLDPPCMALKGFFFWQLCSIVLSHSTVLMSLPQGQILYFPSGTVGL